MDLAGIANFANVDWIGMTNYLEIFKDEVFLQALSNTVVYVVIGVPLVIALSLSIAIAINFGRGKVFEWFRVVFYMPSITNVVAVAVVWGFLFNPQYGLFNFILNTIGLPDVPWLQDPFVAKLSLILLALWRAVGINMIIFLAASIRDSAYLL